jgi:alanyl-tRNA synthetase
MERMKSDELRTAFLDYFAARGHTLVPSSSLIPQKDPTLLFTNAGMVQFKEVFTGTDLRPYRRAVTAQKCMRAGGKHNDLERVGETGRHHTFFEMLGNFSFGDYFKKEAIAYAWELLTAAFHLPKDRLWITIYQDDDEAHRLWLKIGIPPDRIVRLGEADNFWAMGETGPCGPCSEVIYDQGEAVVDAAHRPVCLGISCDCDRYLEVWNLVFMQYNRDGEGKLTPLPKPSIDTGMGLERIAAVTQGVKSNFETDLFRPLFEALARISDREAETLMNEKAGRVITDHLRAITFLISDGVLPSNEGRGYVLRRVIRRAARHGREIGLSEPFLYRLTGEVVDRMKGSYPELVKTRTLVAQVTQGEEEQFIETLNRALGPWEELIKQEQKQGNRVVSGREAFRFYDTYGLPSDIAFDVATDLGSNVTAATTAGFEAAMEEQKDRARRAWVVKEAAPYYREASSRFGRTEFVGYDSLEEEVRLLGILKEGKPVIRAVAGETVELVLDRTPFYGESGGQVGDQGLLEHPSALAEIHATIKPVPDLFIHQAKVTQGEILEGETYRAVVNRAARTGAARNHTATHILHAVLREILGEHVKQSGSLVAPDRLRFDFTHFKALSPQEIKRIEEVVNERVRGDDPVETRVMDFHEALRAGALAFFDDKYGDRVRVVRIGEFSKELCGGTHCHDTGEVGLFKLVQESSIAAGMRRIEAITGEIAYASVRKQEEDLQELAAFLKVKPVEVVEKTKRLLTAFREKEKELERLKEKEIAKEAKGLSDRDTFTVSGIMVARKKFPGLEMSDLRIAADSIKSAIGSGITVVGSTTDAGIANLFITGTKDVADKVPANQLIAELAPMIEGKGGGRPESAQAGGKKPEGLDAALSPDVLKKAIEKILKKKV